MATPERLDRVQVRVGDAIVTMPWADREWLLGELRRFESARGIVRAFERAGASRPVELTDAGQEELADVIFRLGAQALGPEHLPGGVRELMDAIDGKL